MTQVVVTGVAGFIGSHLAETLLQQGYSVVGVDHFNDYYDPRHKRLNLVPFREHPRFSLVEGEIHTLPWGDLLSKVEIIYHQAAQAGVRASWGKEFQLYTDRNLNATQVLLEAAKTAPKLRRFVYASSSSIYGDATTLPTRETLCPAPVSPYGMTKLAAEQLAFIYHRSFGVPVVALRYFTVYGPRQRPDMAFHRFLRTALTGEAIAIYGDGQQTRDFTFIGDAIAANLTAGTLPAAVGEVFNIGGGSRVSLAEVLDTLDDLLPQPLRRQYGDPARGDARHTAADITKAQTLLGYRPQVALAEGLEAQWHWLKDRYHQLP